MKTLLMPPALALYFVLTLVVPVVRHRLKYGEWPLTFARSGDSIQRLMGGQMALLFGAAFLWALLTATVSWSTLGVWQLPSWVDPFGWVLVLAGALLVAWAQWTMSRSFRVGIDERPTDLVTQGPFRLTRNPIFTGLLASVAGFVLLAPAAWSVMALAWMLSLIALQVRLEEAHLVRLHGGAYRVYAAAVGRFVPSFGRLTP
jgi:protein-S-isoprenylcysteine O-methyltransferase Ste14